MPTDRSISRGRSPSKISGHPRRDSSITSGGIRSIDGGVRLDEGESSRSRSRPGGPDSDGSRPRRREDGAHRQSRSESARADSRSSGLETTSTSIDRAVTDEPCTGDLSHDQVARVITGMVTNEGVSNPTLELLRSRKQDSNDFAQAIMTASDYIVHNCTRLQETQPDNNTLAVYLSKWRPVLKDGYERTCIAPRGMQSHTLWACLEDAADVYQRVHGGVNEEGATVPRGAKTSKGDRTRVRGRDTPRKEQLKALAELDLEANPPPRFFY